MNNALDALKIAREALKERRAYAFALEYKYGTEWDNEDGYIQEAIDKLEAEKREHPACETCAYTLDRVHDSDKPCSGCIRFAFWTARP
jgi:hypothetical protein